MMATFHYTNANKPAFDSGNPLDLKCLKYEVKAHFLLQHFTTFTVILYLLFSKINIT